MNPNEVVLVGRVKDAHGMKGELFITLKAGQADWLKDFKEFQLQSKSKDQSKDFKVIKARVHKNGLIVVAEGIPHRTQAEGFKGWDFLIPKSLIELAPESGEIYLGQVLGFKVEVKGRGEIGEVTGFRSHSAQDLLVVQAKDSEKEWEIPFVEPFIEKLDFESKKILMELPEGLLEVNEEVDKEVSEEEE